MPITLIILGLSIILLLIYVLLYWRSYVAVPAQTPFVPQPSGSKPVPSISVVIITHDSDDQLELMLDKVATQDYSDFEIVIVNNASTDNTNDVIKRAIVKYPGLIRSTYLPQNKNGILHMSMATTLGVRASRKEWIVLLKPTSTPKSKYWLQSLGDAISQGCSLCIGYNQYYGYDDSSWVRRAIAWRQKTQILNFRAIYRGRCKPIEAESTNIAFRKVDFSNNGGYGKWLDVKNYHENLYATTFYGPRTTRMLTQSDAQVETLLPPIEELWETDRNLMKKSYKKLSISTKLRRNYYTSLTWFYTLAVVVLLAGIMVGLYPIAVDNTNQIIDYNVYLGIDMPILVPSTALLFVIISLSHLFTKIYKNKKDKKNIQTALVSTPINDLIDDERI